MTFKYFLFWTAMNIQVEFQIPSLWYLKQPFHDLLSWAPSNWSVIHAPQFKTIARSLRQFLCISSPDVWLICKYRERFVLSSLIVNSKWRGWYLNPIFCSKTKAEFSDSWPKLVTSIPTAAVLQKDIQNWLAVIIWSFTCICKI